MDFNRREAPKLHEKNFSRGKYIFAKCNILVFCIFLLYALQHYLYFHERIPVQQKCKNKHAHFAQLKPQFCSQQRLLTTEQRKNREIALQKYI
jgi:hypothetical protein